MLKNLKIIQYRSCQNVELNNIGNLLVLVGRNGAGKSNIMKAIDWAAKTITNHPAMNNSSNFILTKNGEIEIDLELNNNLYKYSLKHLPNKERNNEIDFIESLKIFKDKAFVDILSRNNEDVIINGPTQTLGISSTISVIPALQSLLPDSNSIKPILDEISGFAKSISYYPLTTDGVETADESSLEDFFLRYGDYLEWRSGKANNGSNTRILMHKILDMYLKDTPKFNELKSLIGNDGLGLIEDIKVHYIKAPDQEDGAELSPNSFHIMFFRPCGHNVDAAFRLFDLSYGTRRILHFIVSLLYDNTSVALIEQIEDGIHDGLIDKLIPLIRDYSIDSQYIIASHSTAVFNRLEPNEVAIVELHAGKTSARVLTQIELDAACSYMREDGPFSDFLESIG